MNDIGISHEAKQTFHRKYAARLRAVAAALGLGKGTFEVRSNKGGPAVMGEVILHGERLYVTTVEFGNPGPQLLFRPCSGRKDYGAGMDCPNSYIPLAWLDDVKSADFARAVNALRDVAERGPGARAAQYGVARRIAR